MQKAIDEQLSQKPKQLLPDSIETFIKSELIQFERDGTRGKFLELCYNALKTVPPTSVESERAFSAAGAICTKIRSSLNDETLDTLCFLRAFFKNNKN